MKTNRKRKRFDGVDFCLKLQRVVLQNPASLCTSPSSEQLYQIVWRINPRGREHESEVVKGDPNPEWNEECTIDLNKCNPMKVDLFLDVEVITYNRVENRRDPGTSDGIGEVLRARIPFPKVLNDKVEGEYELVKFDGTGVKVAGHISLSMELETYVWKKKSPQSTRPAREGDIPVRVKNSYKSNAPGTVITHARDMSKLQQYARALHQAFFGEQARVIHMEIEFESRNGSLKTLSERQLCSAGYLKVVDSHREFLRVISLR